MKKHRLYAVLAAMVMAFALVLAGCQQPSSGGDSGSVAVDYWSKAAVGDIVLTDGTFVSPGNFTTGMKAVAVIVRAKSESTPALGVGIHHNRTGLAWCTSSAKGYNTNITALQGTTIGDYTDGSDGWEKLKTVCSDAATNPENYPAWNFCNTYAATYGLTGNLAKGWYLPTVAELSTICENKDKIGASLGVAGGVSFGKSWYWSCCQSFSYDDSVYILDFNHGGTVDARKHYSDYYVCSVRAFN